jgi:transcriptional regulator with XRE-family HTH domain
MDSPLKAARLRRGETLQQVADAIGSNTGNLSRIERGQVPNSKLTAKIIAYFGGEISEFQLLQTEMEAA